MAILGKDHFGRINPGMNRLIEEEESNEEIEKFEMPKIDDSQLSGESMNSQDPKASLEYLDRMRDIRNMSKKPIGNSIQSDAKAFDPNNKFNH